VTRVSSRAGLCSPPTGEITIEDIRRSDGEERGGIEAYMSAIADFNELVFGAETAELLRRRARAAAQQKTGS
jgi:hypothetical protein